MARACFDGGGIMDMKLRILSNHNKDGCEYNMPTCLEIVALVVGDLDSSNCQWDVIVDYKKKGYKEFHSCILPLWQWLIHSYFHMKNMGFVLE